MKLLQKKKLGWMPALSCAFVMCHTASASVIITVSDDGTDLTYTITGTIDRSGDVAANVNIPPSLEFVDADSSQLFSLGGNNFSSGSGIGVVSGLDPYILSTYNNDPGDGIGVLSGGFSGTSLFWDVSLGADPDTVTYDRTFVQTGQTVATAFGTNLDAGPVVLWTHTNSGDTFSIQAVPEPSSSALLILGFAGLAVRRRR